MSKKVLTGYNYAAVSAVPTTITDSNGITLCEVKVGQIAYFTATTDIVDCGTDDVHVVQIRSNYTVPSTGGGGGVDPTPYLERIAELEGLIDAIEQVIAALEADITAKRTQIAELQGQLAELQAELAELQAIMNGRIIGVNDAGSVVQMGQYLTQGGLFTNRQDIGEWYGSLPALTVSHATVGSEIHGFFSNSSITGFHGDLPALTDGKAMFSYCPNLSSLTIPSGTLPSLTSGENMFFWIAIESFDIALPNLVNGRNMFEHCDKLTEFTSELPLVQNGVYMFSDCTSLESFGVALPSLVNADNMFGYDENLTSFTSVLSDSLTSADYMFGYCKLDKASVQNIANTIPTWTSGTHKITIGVDSSKITQAEQNAFNATIVGKGWTVTWERN